jgi:hypothetical protein
MPVVVDFLLEKINLYTNVDSLRFCTGLVFGVALLHLLILSVAVQDQETINKNSKIPKLAVNALQDSKLG